MRRYNIPQCKNRRVKSQGGKKGSKNVAPISPTVEDGNEPFPLHSAVVRNSPEEVLALLHKGANPNQQLAGGATPLHCLFLSTTPSTEDYHAHVCIKSGSQIRNAILIINYLVGKGSRLLPDLYGLTPISLAVYSRSSMLLSMKLLFIAQCSVADVIHYNNFTMNKPPSRGGPNPLKHQLRLQRALLVHVKHGITPHHDPLFTYTQFLTSLFTTQLSDHMDVYASQFSSFLALRSSRRELLFTGVRTFIEQVSNEVVCETTDITKFVPLFRTLLAWLNSHEILSEQDAINSWKHVVYVLGNKAVREKIDSIAPSMIEFLYKFVLPLIESSQTDVHRPDIVHSASLVIILMKVISASEHSHLFPRSDQDKIFAILNRKQFVLASIYYYEHYSIGYKKMSIDASELFEFAMSHMFNLNERTFGNGGTIVHAMASYGNSHLLRYFLKAGVSPFIKDYSGDTFIDILKRHGHYALSDDICKEFKIHRPYNLKVLSANVYIRFRLPLAHLHKYPLLRHFVLQLCSKKQCLQMCSHCYKEYFY